MGSVYDETNNKTYILIADKPLVIGRLQVNKQDQRLSRSHVQITLLNDQRCFVKAMSRNLCTLDNAILPRQLNEQGQEEGQEVEAFNGQWIHLLPGKLYPLKLTLPNAMTTPMPRKPFMEHKMKNNLGIDNDDTDSGGDSDENMNTFKEQSDDSMDDEENVDEVNATPSEQDRYPSTPSSIISTESSLLGGESWSD